jgi:hypothetical protein
MSFLSKLGVTQPRTPLTTSGRDVRGSSPVRAQEATLQKPANSLLGRTSNGLKEFLSQIDGIGRGQMLDLGPVSQTTLNFFIERGFKVYAEDLLTAWSGFLNEEEARSRGAQPQEDSPDRSPAALAERFLASNLAHGPNSLDAVLLWDLLDYLDREMASRVVARLTSLVRDGGAVLTVFHTKMPEKFCRYRVLDAVNLAVVPAPALLPPKHVYQNREIQDLFGRFRTSKSFVGRDQLRESVFVK